MPSITVSRVFLLCLTAFALFPPLCRADDTNPKNGKPGQFTNGQNGTPNLPLAPSMIVDKNNMRGRLNSQGYSTEALFHKQNMFLTQVYAATNQIATDLKQKPGDPIKLHNDYVALQELILKAHTDSQKNDPQLQLPNQYFYVGAEVRAGADKPTFGPEVTVGDTRSGLEFGVAEYFQSAQIDGMRRRDSVGLSLKYIPNSLATHIVQGDEDPKKNLQHLLQKINSLEYYSDDTTPLTSLTQLLFKAVNRPEEADSQKINSVSRLLSIRLPPDTPIIVAPVNKIALRTIQQAFDNDVTAARVATDNSFQEFVKKVTEPATALIVGEQLFNGGGDVWNAGITASELHPFGNKGEPGLTGLLAAQYFHASLSDFQREGLRTGLAIIYQDSTLYLQSPTQLSLPWHYKVGIEYTSPVLGLHDTKAVFVRYRDPHSYAEITLTYGEDGLGKNYADVNIGKTITF
jgi:hypothetical protein